jgi:hypothetical protein
MASFSGWTHRQAEALLSLYLECMAECITGRQPDKHEGEAHCAFHVYRGQFLCSPVQNWDDGLHLAWVAKFCVPVNQFVITADG